MTYTGAAAGANVYNRQRALLPRPEMLLRLAATLLLTLGISTAFAQETTYRFSPVNQWDINKTAAYWNPI